MTLLVRTPGGCPAERRYVLDVVLGEWLGLPWRLETAEHPEVRIGAGDDPAGPAVTLPDVLFRVAESRWLTRSALPSVPLPRAVPGAAGAGVLDPAERLPVLYGAPDADRPLVEPDAAGARLRVDVFGSVFALLTRYEEAVAGERDSYQRFPAATSLAARAGFLQVPLVDAYVELLWAALHRVWPRLTRRPRDYRVLLTHDVDDPLSTLGRRPALLARQLAGDLVRRRDPGLLLRRARALADARRGKLDRDPHNTFDFLMDTSERHGLRSAFYFLANNDVNPRGGRYDLVDHPWVQGLMGRVAGRGHEVGFHAGFGTYRDPERTAEEFGRVRRIAEDRGVRQQHWGGRQHYLQWSNPQTWRNWAEAGLDYDCTLGFSEAVGFRTGTCHEYPVFDLLARRPLALRERPFQVMDVTLFGHLGLDRVAARATVLDIARQCRRFGGSLGLLWHNDEVLRTARERRWYSSLIDAVVRPDHDPGGTGSMVSGPGRATG
jgi:hypothetical protein